MPTNLDSFYPFDAGAGSAITESQWRDMARHWLGTGVINGEVNTFAVSQRGAGANMSVDVATGRAWVRGHYGESTAIKNLSIATAHATQARIDRVILRADFAANKVELDVLTGTPSGSPTAPTLTQSTSMWEISLARVAVAAAASSITTANITDERTYTTPGARVFRSTAQSLTNVTLTAISLSTETWDYGNDAWSSTDATKVYLRRVGRWLVTGQVAFTSNATGFRQASIDFNGGAVAYQIGPAVSGNESILNVTTVLHTSAVTDFVRLMAYQNSGGALDTTGGAGFTYLATTYLGA